VEGISHNSAFSRDVNSIILFLYKPPHLRFLGFQKFPVLNRGIVKELCKFVLTFSRDLMKNKSKNQNKPTLKPTSKPIKNQSKIPDNS
jgi:hypothetical protein